jgi:hypothetical protein
MPRIGEETGVDRVQPEEIRPLPRQPLGRHGKVLVVAEPAAFGRAQRVQRKHHAPRPRRRRQAARRDDERAGRPADLDPVEAERQGRQRVAPPLSRGSVLALERPRGACGDEAAQGPPGLAHDPGGNGPRALLRLERGEPFGGILPALDAKPHRGEERAHRGPPRPPSPPGLVGVGGDDPGPLRQARQRVSHRETPARRRRRRVLRPGEAVPPPRVRTMRRRCGSRASTPSPRAARGGGHGRAPPRR